MFELNLNKMVTNLKRGLVDFDTALAYTNGYLDCLEDAGIIDNKSELFNMYTAELLEIKK